jgi:FMN phosphatase YigB (HAD superfamily)
MITRTLLSYDVFDTAVTRLVLNPDHLHWMVGVRLRAERIVMTGADSWRASRRKAEDVLRRRMPQTEITLGEIYSELATAIHLTPEQMHSAMAIEIAQEIKLARPIAVTRDKIRTDMREGREQCFISDTYLNAEQINELLVGCGYGPLKVHVSSEYRKTKAHGDLFAAVGAQHNVLCKDMTHFGDNVVSDVSRARSVGCTALLFEGSQPTKREQVLFAAGMPGYLSSAVAGSARAARLEYADSCSAGIRTASTSVAGPLLTAYVFWVLLDVVKRGGRTIYFLARDGQILHRICERLIAYLKLDVESRYLLGSRKAFFLAALPPDLKGAITSAFALAPSETVLGVLIALGLEISECKSTISNAGVSADERAGKISEIGLQAICAHLSNNPQSASDLVDRITTAKAATQQYFAQEGIFANEMAYVADLGWHGNLQLRMQRIIGDRTKLCGYYVHLYRTPDEIADAVRTWAVDNWPRAALLEVFTLADHTSTHGFQLDSENKAVCAPRLEEATDLVAWGVRHQHELIDLFVRNILLAVDPFLYDAEKLAVALKDGGIAAFTDFVRFPTRAEGDAYGSIALAGDQNHIDVREIAPAVSNIDAIRMLGDGGIRRARTNWFQGSLARSADKTAPAALRAIYSTMTRLRALSR